MAITFILILLLATMIFFSLDIVSFDVVVMIAVVIMVIAGIISTKEAFEGFGNDFIIMLAAIFLIGSSLQHNGVIDFMSGKLSSIKKMNTFLLLLIVMVTVGVLSAFMNNTTVAAVFIPPVISVCKKFKISPSKILMPMAFASLMGGTCTLIGTSTNVAGSGFMAANGMKPLTMFELLPLGGIIFIVGIIYMLAIGLRLLPGSREETLTDEKYFRTYHAEVVAETGSPIIGKTTEQAAKESAGIKILSIYSKQEKQDRTIVCENDILLISGDKDSLLKFRNLNKLLIKQNSEHEKESELQLAEIMVLPTSYLLNSTLGETYFQQQNRVTVLAVHRKNEMINKRIKDIKVKTGDMLLVEGTKENLALIRKRSNFIIVNETVITNKSSLRKGWLTSLFFVLAIILGTLNIIPISIAFLITAVLVVLIKAVPADGLYSAVDWRLLILIGGMTAFGTALHKTGADKFLAEIIIQWLEPYGKYALLAGFMLLTALLTQPLSNAAAALVVLPIAIQTAELLHLPARTFCIAIITSASISMIAPFEPCSLLVFTPGRYKIKDFIKTGGLLTLIALLLILWLVPVFWGF